MPAISTEAQKLAPGARVMLFALDTTKVGGPVWYFTNSSDTPIFFGGQEYTPVGVELRGLTTSGVADLPRPELVIANAPIIQSMVNTWGALNGCKLSRLRTFARFLDGQAEADPTAFYGPDVFEFDRKSSDTETEIVWELSATIDQEGATVGREMIRDTCMSRYREFNTVTETFDYSNAVCPYAGPKFYNQDDVEVPDASDDKPSRGLDCCRARFGRGNPLPFGGFVGIQRSKT